MRFAEAERDALREQVRKLREALERAAMSLADAGWWQARDSARGVLADTEEPSR